MSGEILVSSQPQAPAVGISGFPTVLSVISSVILLRQLTGSPPLLSPPTCFGEADVVGLAPARSTCALYLHYVYVRGTGSVIFYALKVEPTNYTLELGDPRRGCGKNAGAHASLYASTFRQTGAPLRQKNCLSARLLHQRRGNITRRSLQCLRTYRRSSYYCP